MKTADNQTPQQPQRRKTVLRRCVGCMEMKEKRSLIRVVKTDTGAELDETGKKPGRGAYICKSPECVAKACKHRGLDRSFKQPVPAVVYEYIKSEMEKLFQTSNEMGI